MAKRFFFFAFLFLASICMQAQSIVGTWKNSMAEDDMKIDIFYVFTQSTVNIKFSAEIKNAELGTFVFSTNIPSTYTKNANKLTLRAQAGRTKMTMDKMELAPKISELASQNPEFKKMIEDQMKQLMDESMKEIVEGMTEDGELTIIKNDGTNLTLKDKSGNNMNFIKLK